MTMVRIDVQDCARCGEKHRRLIFESFDRPVALKDQQWTHWALCPRSRQPILMMRGVAE